MTRVQNTKVINHPARIAYDISWVVDFLHRKDRQSGLNRVVEEVLQGLLLSKEIDLSVVGLVADDIHPVLTSCRARVYKEVVLGDLCRHVPTYTSRFGLSPIFNKPLMRHLRAAVTPVTSPIPSSQQSHNPVVFGTHAQVLRRFIKAHARRVLTRILSVDGRQHLDASFDIFHSPYPPLPPPHITGNVKRLLTIYDLIPLTGPSDWVLPAWRELFMKILRSLDIHRDFAICISHFTKNELCAATGIAPDRVFVSQLAAADHFRPVSDPQKIAAVRRKYNIPPGDYLLSLCTPQPRKNLAHLVRCFVRLITERPDIGTNLVLVGGSLDGPQKLEVEIKNEYPAEISKRIIFTGYADDDNLSPIYSGSLAFIFPSLSEGFGLPPLEAMQCGTPVICSNTTSLPEVVGDAAILIDPCSESQLCEAMALVISTPSLVASMRRKSLARATLFSWSRCAVQTIEAYKQIRK